VSVTKCTFKCSNTIADKGDVRHAGGVATTEWHAKMIYGQSTQTRAGQKIDTRPWPRRSMHEGHMQVARGGNGGRNSGVFQWFCTTT